MTMKLAIALSLVTISCAFAETLDFDFPKEMPSIEVAGHILNANPETVQITKINESQAVELHHSLQNDYNHFIYIPGSSLFIASKNQLQLFTMKSGGNDNEPGGEVRGGANISWGGDDGIKVEGFIKGEAHDGNGNFVEVEVRQGDDGRGKASVNGGHEE